MLLVKRILLNKWNFELNNHDASTKLKILDLYELTQKVYVKQKTHKVLHKTSI